MRSNELPVRPPACHAATLVIVGSALAPLAWATYPTDQPLEKPGWMLLGFAAALFIVAIDEMWRYRTPGTSTSRMAHNLLVASYCGVLTGFLIELRLLDPSEKGMLALIATIVTVKLSDTGAYFVGRSLGRTKLAPVLSPRKTVEGALGGIIAACLGSALTFLIIGPSVMGIKSSQTSMVAICGFGISLAVAGMIGDLFESLLKRDANTKDSSGWLPGLGGVLDILDSVPVAAPVSFAWWASGVLT
jgi:phosphatidate cytidylyltransferase